MQSVLNRLQYLIEQNINPQEKMPYDGSVKCATDLARKIIPEEDIEFMKREQIAYIGGLAYAMQLIEQHVSDFMVPFNHYFVIMYRDAKRKDAYIEEMKLFRIIKSESITSYLFTKDLDARITYRRDLILRSNKQILERVFLTRESAEKAIRRKEKRRKKKSNE